MISKLEKIENKLQILVDRYNALKEENENLKQENKKIRLQKEENGNLNDGQDTINVSRVSNREVVKELNKYISEVDQCIKMLKAE
ncbi:MAG TPA: hypothetical protein PK147_02600 [Saprospiraceae bacterium]|nr:hypothetical protein [Saprospiraceae bacterium]MCB9328090.1 hypothetical protein [Lewinellaceae bacterium]HPK09277.1 hypothetical protein [Saprospiraceae bacterium]HPQ20708.1 hypothetical protein [Saprospiraceae bacterium]HRX29391.1 hypothetical protein [Saprospiraceae bacterium]